MRGGRDLHDVGLGKVGGDVTENPRMKAGIVHPPDDLYGLGGE